MAPFKWGGERENTTYYQLAMFLPQFRQFVNAEVADSVETRTLYSWHIPILIAGILLHMYYNTKMFQPQI